MEPARWRLADRPLPQGPDVPQSRRATRLPARYDLASPGNQAKLDAVEELALLAEDAGLSLIHLALAFTHPSRSDSADHRPSHDGATGVAARRGRGHAEQRHP